MAKHERTRVEGARVLSCLAIALPLLNMDKHCGMMNSFMFSHGGDGCFFLWILGGSWFSMDEMGVGCFVIFFFFSSWLAMSRVKILPNPTSKSKSTRGASRPARAESRFGNI